MKIKIKGEMGFAAALQCIFENFFELEELYNVRYVRGLTIYMTLTNGVGDEVHCRDGRGETITTVRSEGPYRSVAEDYEI